MTATLEAGLEASAAAVAASTGALVAVDFITCPSLITCTGIWLVAA